MRRVWRLGLGLVTVVGAGLLYLGWKSSGRAIHPQPAVMPWSPADFPDLHAEPVTVHSRTGVALAARFYRGENGATVVLSHGYGGNQDEMLPVASALNRAGFNVLSYDLRGSGASGGEVTFGTLEQEDLRSVVDHVAGRDDVDADRIGALGFSMGAATTLLAAADDRRIRAVVDDSGWSDVHDWMRPRLADVFLKPRHQFTPLALELAELRTDADLGALRPEAEIGRLAPRPVLIIHGTADEAVLPRDSEANFAAAREPKELWLIDGAEHGETIRPGGATTSGRVVRFLTQALAP